MYSRTIEARDTFPRRVLQRVLHPIWTLLQNDCKGILRNKLYYKITGDHCKVIEEDSLVTERCTTKYWENLPNAGCVARFTQDSRDLPIIFNHPTVHTRSFISEERILPRRIRNCARPHDLSCVMREQVIKQSCTCTYKATVLSYTVARRPSRPSHYYHDDSGRARCGWHSAWCTTGPAGETYPRPTTPPSPHSDFRALQRLLPSGETHRHVRRPGQAADR